jgi:hypothetical protein
LSPRKLVHTNSASITRFPLAVERVWPSLSRGVSWVEFSGVVTLYA